MAKALQKFLKPLFEVPKEAADIANLKKHAKAGNKEAINLLETMTAGKPARKSKDKVPANLAKPLAGAPPHGAEPRKLAGPKGGPPTKGQIKKLGEMRQDYSGADSFPDLSLKEHPEEVEHFKRLGELHPSSVRSEWDLWQRFPGQMGPDGWEPMSFQDWFNFRKTGILPE
jgi:hypothetical protein